MHHARRTLTVSGAGQSTWFSALKWGQDLSLLHHTHHGLPLARTTPWQVRSPIEVLPLRLPYLGISQPVLTLVCNQDRKPQD